MIVFGRIPFTPGLDRRYDLAAQRIVRLLERSAGLPLGLLTNNIAPLPREGELGEILELFDAVVESSVEGIRKPEPEIYRRALDRLAAERPDDAVVGEEGASRPGTSGRTWVIDPVDGTYNFARGSDWWCSAIALVSTDPDGEEEVFDATVPGIHAFDAAGLLVHNCAEQPLPPYGACLLGSINLARFVRDPFTPAAHLDETELADVVAVEEDRALSLGDVVEPGGQGQQGALARAARAEHAHGHPRLDLQVDPVQHERPIRRI